jgi:hypothetical protein
MTVSECKPVDASQPIGAPGRLRSIPAVAVNRRVSDAQGRSEVFTGDVRAASQQSEDQLVWLITISSTLVTIALLALYRWQRGAIG